MSVSILVNPDISSLDLKALYEFRGVKARDRAIRAMLRRNGSFWQGLMGAQQIVEVDEKQCFALASQYDDLKTDSALDQNNKYAFTRAGAWIQREKLNKGIPLDCPKSSYIDGMQLDVLQYADNPS